MVIFRPTSSLAAKMGLKIAATPLRSETRLGDWYAKDIRLGTRHMVLCVNELSRLAVVMDGAPYASIPERFPAAVRQLLEAIVPSTKEIGLELAAMQTISIAKTSSRSVLGSMNEYELMLGYMRDFEPNIGSMDLLNLSLKLSDSPTSTVPEIFPKLAASRLLSARDT
jgi:hypothetical protein